MPSEAVLWVTLAAAILAAVFLAAAEASLLRISEVRAASAAERHGRRGRRLRKLVADLPRVLNTILLGALLAQITAATVTGMIAERHFGSLGVTAASIVLTMLLFIYAEAIPKTFALRHTDQVALAVAEPVALLVWLLRPIVSVLVWFADLQAPGKGIATAPTVTEDELRLLARRAAVEGEIEPADRDLIERAFRLGDRRVDDIMVPRTDVVGVPAAAGVDEAVDVAIASGHRRLVVYGESLDDVVGVVRLRDLVALPDDAANRPVGEVASTPLVVPESKRVLELLREMQAAGLHLAVVVDEYGGTAGIATIEDIVEELLGSIDEFGSAEPGIVEVAPGVFSVPGLLPVEDLADLVGVEITEGDWNTVAGLVVGLLGRLPHVGDEVDLDGQRLRVTSVRGHRIQRVRVETAPT